ncbi:MAG: ABC1 kinase family protein [Candidatus Longimicrobiales bacterium M2_2A_002]
MADHSRSQQGRSTFRRAIEVGRVLRRHNLLAFKARPSPEDAREALEELGPVFQKFGQVLALRRDLLPDPFVRELESLHDRVAPLAYDTVRGVVERELEGPVDELFASFDPSPLASATIAQVHSARLADGRHVVVKVRRPHLQSAVDRDTAVLAWVARAVDLLVPAARPLDLPAMVREFRDSLRREADFRLEARSIGRFRASLRSVEQVWVPDVIPELSTRAVLVMEHSPGMRIDHYVREHPEESRDLAGGVAALVLRQIFEDGLFHADPHPGNLFVLPDGRLCLHDFGMIGELSESMRLGLGDLLEAEVRGNTEAAVDAYLRLGFPAEEANRDVLKREFDRILAELHARPLSEVSLGEEMQKLLRVGGRNRIRNPRELLLLARAFLIAEALIRRLDPDINVIEVFRAQLGRLRLQRLAPDRIMDKGVDFAHFLERLSRDFPGALDVFLKRLAADDSGQVPDPQLIREVREVKRLLRTLVEATAGGIVVLIGTGLAMAYPGLVLLGGAGAVVGAGVVLHAVIDAGRAD